MVSVIRIQRARPWWFRLFAHLWTKPTILLPGICRATWQQDIIYHKASTTAGNSYQRGPRLNSVAHCVFRAVRWGVSSNNSWQKEWSKFWEAGWARHWTIPPRSLHLILRWEIRPSSICVHTNGRSYLGMKRPCGNYSCCIPAEGGWWQGSQCIINMCRSSPEEEACWNPHVQERGGGGNGIWMASASYSPCVPCVLKSFSSSTLLISNISFVSATPARFFSPFVHVYAWWRLRVLIYDGKLTRNLDSDTIHNQT